MPVVPLTHGAHFIGRQCTGSRAQPWLRPSSGAAKRCREVMQIRDGSLTTSNISGERSETTCRTGPFFQTVRGEKTTPFRQLIPNHRITVQCD